MPPKFSVLTAAIAVVCLAVSTNALISPVPKLRNHASSSVPYNSISPRSSSRTNLLFRTQSLRVSRQSNENDLKKGIRLPFFLIFKKMSNLTQQWMLNVRQREWSNIVKRFALSLCATAVIWFSAAGYQAPPAYAAPSISLERIAPSAPLEKMVDRYVKDYMFDDPVYDSVESMMKEVFEDSTTAEHPTALKDINKDIAAKDTKKNKREGETNLINLILNTSESISEKFNLPAMGTAITLAFSLTAVLYLVLNKGFGMLFNKSQRDARKMMTERYDESIGIVRRKEQLKQEMERAKKEEAEKKENGEDNDDDDDGDKGGDDGNKGGDDEDKGGDDDDNKND